jgi:hypothetical protein
MDRIFARDRVLELRKQGYSYRQIGRQLKIGEGTVRRVLIDRLESTQLLKGEEATTARYDGHR